VDIFIEVPRIEYEKLVDDRLGEKSAVIQARVEAARVIQQKRFKGTKLTCNADMTPIEIREFCRTEPEAQNLLQAAVKQLSLSARSFHHILKLSLTIADLDGAGTIGSTHVAEALQYRSRQMM
jgi:magnesium chelatase family protein